MKTGIYRDITIEDYHKDREIVSSTGLKQAKKSSRHFVHYLINGSNNTQTFDFGNAFELALMDAVNDTDLFEKNVAVIPTIDYGQQALKEKPDLERPKASALYRTLCKDFQIENVGKYIIPDVGDESNELMQSMISGVMNDDITRKLITNTEYQVTLVWQDSDTGLLLKTRPDICRSKQNIIIDIKTCRDASPKGFTRDLANLEYPLQAVMQIDGVINTGLMDKVDGYYWLAVEKSEVPNHALYRFQQDDIEFCFDMYDFYLKRCANTINELRKNDYDIYKIPSYGENADSKHGIIDIELPLYYRN